MAGHGRLGGKYYKASGMVSLGATFCVNRASGVSGFGQCEESCQPVTGWHTVGVQEEDELAARGLDAPIAGCGRAGVWLLQ